MNDSAPVCVLERGGQCGAYGTNFLVGERRRALDVVLQVATLDQLHDDERRARFGVLADVINGDDVRVTQARGRARLTSEAFEKFWLVGELRVEHLDSNMSVEQRVVRLPNSPLPAPAVLAVERVATPKHAPAHSARPPPTVARASRRVGRGTSGAAAAGTGRMTPRRSG